MKKISLLLPIIIVAFTGCASYQANSLAALDPDYVRSYREADGMEIGCKTYTVDECYTYLDRNIIAKGFQPVQLTFNNTSDKRYIFSTENITLPCVNSEGVAKKVRTWTLVRFGGYSIGGYFLWPLFLPAIVDGIKSFNANTALNKDFDEKAKETFVIGPHSFSKTLIFIPIDDFSSAFNLSLLNEETGKHEVISFSDIK